MAAFLSHAGEPSLWIQHQIGHWRDEILLNHLSTRWKRLMHKRHDHRPPSERIKQNDAYFPAWERPKRLYCTDHKRSF